jgi:hypothetical protein
LFSRRVKIDLFTQKMPVKINHFPSLMHKHKPNKKIGSIGKQHSQIGNLGVLGAK